MEKAPEFVHAVRAQTIRGILVDAKDLIYKLGWEDIPEEFWKELVHDQCRLAVRKSNWPWIETARYYAGLRFPSDWVDEVLPEKHKIPLTAPPAETLSQQAFFNEQDKEIKQMELREQNMVACLKNHTPIQEELSNNFQGGHDYMNVVCKRERDPVEDFELSEQSYPRSDQSCPRSDHGCPRSDQSCPKPIKSLLDINVFEPIEHRIPKRARISIDIAEQRNLKTIRLPIKSPNVDVALQDFEMRKSKNYHKPGRTQKCPVQGCLEETSHVRRHAEEFHVPHLFWEYETRPLEEVHSARLRALFRLAQWIVEDRDLGKLVFWANRSLKFSHNVRVPPVSQAAMQHLCHMARWPMPTKFEISPINSPAALLHWRVICGLLDTLHPEQRHAFLADPEGARFDTGEEIGLPSLSSLRETHYAHTYPGNFFQQGFADKELEARRDYATRGMWYNS